MDLRKKNSPIRSLGEFALRFRLIFVAVFAVPYVVFVRDFRAISVYALDSVKAFLDGVGIPSEICVPLSDCSAPVLAGCVALFLACFLFVRIAALKTLLPAILSVFFFTAISASAELPKSEYLALAFVDFAGLLAVGICAGISLKGGAPVAGAVTRGFAKAFFPVLVLHALVGGIFGYLFWNASDPLTLVFFPVISLFLFLFAEFPMFTFAPMGKMRAGRRSMKI